MANNRLTAAFQGCGNKRASLSVIETKTMRKLPELTSLIQQNTTNTHDVRTPQTALGIGARGRRSYTYACLAKEK